VRASGLASPSTETNHKTKQFDENWINNLDRLRKRLKSRTFAFANETGIAPLKGKGKQGRRPLVVAPTENRIVRRAILDVLQGYGDEASNSRIRWSGIPAVRDVLETATSVGGIRHRGVPLGLAFIDQAVRTGHHWFIRSDIKNFFTRIPLRDVNTFISNAVADPDFSTLFAAALATNLTNKQELEERSLFKLFPDNETGVAQGSAISALAGNIVLRQFDEQMNGRGIVCIRYIDDFIILGRSEQNVKSAYSSARAILKRIGMDVYDESDALARKSGKFDAGNIYDGTDVLGYRISGTSRQPCAAARKAFLDKLDAVVAKGKREMKAAANGLSSSHVARYHQSMVKLHNVIWGWSQSFRNTTAVHVFESLDRQIDERIAELHNEALRLIDSGSIGTRRRVLGIHLLGDTQLEPLPNISNVEDTAIAEPSLASEAA